VCICLKENAQKEKDWRFQRESSSEEVRGIGHRALMKTGGERALSTELGKQERDTQM
jgi:hypothetical protein